MISWGVNLSRWTWNICRSTALPPRYQFCHSPSPMTACFETNAVVPRRWVHLLQEAWRATIWSSLINNADWYWSSVEVSNSLKEVSSGRLRRVGGQWIDAWIIRRHFHLFHLIFDVKNLHAGKRFVFIYRLIKKAQSAMTVRRTRVSLIFLMFFYQIQPCSEFF